MCVTSIILFIYLLVNSYGRCSTSLKVQTTPTRTRCSRRLTQVSILSRTLPRFNVRPSRTRNRLDVRPLRALHRLDVRHAHTKPVGCAALAHTAPVRCAASACASCTYAACVLCCLSDLPAYTALFSYNHFQLNRPVARLFAAGRKRASTLPRPGKRSASAQHLPVPHPRRFPNPKTRKLRVRAWTSTTLKAQVLVPPSRHPASTSPRR
jgi:hypothetical protein